MKAGRVLDGRYQLVRLLGKGAMGAVWQGNDLKLHRPVAVKVVLDHTDPGLVERMGQEAFAAGRLSHPHIVTVHDYGQADHDGVTVTFIVMELVDGRPLSGVLADGIPELPVALDWARQITLALGAVHAPGVGVVHRDLKPDNVLITGDGLVKLVDFGIARFIGERPEGAAPGTDSGAAPVTGWGAGWVVGSGAGPGSGSAEHPEYAQGDGFPERTDGAGQPGAAGAAGAGGAAGAAGEGMGGGFLDPADFSEEAAFAALAGTGMLSGTPAYMAPEQCLSRPVDGRADLYALGCLLYEMVTGSPPFAGEGSPLAVVVAHVHDTPPAPRSHNDTLPVELDTLILDLLAKDPDDRPPDAAAVYRRLSTIATAAALRGSAPVVPARPPVPDPRTPTDDPAYDVLLRRYVGARRPVAVQRPGEIVRLWWAAAAELSSTLGPHHEQTLTARRALAWHLGATGDHAAATVLWQELIPDLQYTLGHFHRTTFTAQRLLAWNTGVAGRPAEAVRLLLELIPDATRLLGRPHPDILESRRFLVWNVGALGRHSRAVRLLAKLVQDLTEALGPAHEHTLEARRMLAWNTGKSGHLVRAISLLRDLLPEAAAALGPHHDQCAEIRRLLDQYTQ